MQQVPLTSRHAEKREKKEKRKKNNEWLSPRDETRFCHQHHIYCLSLDSLDLGLCQHLLRRQVGHLINEGSPEGAWSTNIVTNSSVLSCKVEGKNSSTKKKKKKKAVLLELIQAVSSFKDKETNVPSNGSSKMIFG